MGFGVTFDRSAVLKVNMTANFVCHRFRGMSSAKLGGTTSFSPLNPRGVSANSPRCRPGLMKNRLKRWTDSPANRPSDELLRVPLLKANTGPVAIARP